MDYTRDDLSEALAFVRAELSKTPRSQPGKRLVLAEARDHLVAVLRKNNPAQLDPGVLRSIGIYRRK